MGGMGDSRPGTPTPENDEYSPLGLDSLGDAGSGAAYEVSAGRSLQTTTTTLWRAAVYFCPLLSATKTSTVLAR